MPPTTPKNTDAKASASKVADTSDSRYSLVTWDCLPHWQQDNHYITGNYRRVSNSYLKSFGSLTYWHNETINIYSHLVPALLSIPSAVVLYRALEPWYEQATQSDVVAFSCFFLGAAMCLGMSATYHTISNHSPMVNRIGNQLDYVGIVLLITGSFVPSIYYGFWCDPVLQKVYWTMVNSSDPFNMTSLTCCTRSPHWELCAQPCPSCNDSAHQRGGPSGQLCSLHLGCQQSFLSCTG